MKKNNKGFSLVELIVVIAIMAILAAVAIPTFATFINRANESADISFMNDVEYAIELAYAAENKTIASVAVELNANTNKPEKVTVSFGQNDNVVINKAAANSDTEEIELVRATIDWEYAFKSDLEDVQENKNWAEGVWTVTEATANNNQQGGQNP